MRLGFEHPLELPAGSSVLVAGCGGGFDVVAGLPVALRLAEEGHRVHLANYCVGDLLAAQGARRERPHLWAVGPDATDPPDVRGFPEGALSRWWSQYRGEPRPVWCFERVGVKPVAEGYRHLHETLALDAVVLVDGGIDGLFLGNEFDTGTPSIDAISIIAAHTLPCRKAFVTSAFGTEGPAYRIRHADVLQRMAELVARRAMLGVGAVLPDTVVGDLFVRAADAIHDSFDSVWHSIIVSSIAAAMRGRFGETRLTPRTDWAPVWISPLTLLYWFFDLDAVALSKPYLEEVRESETVEEMARAIENARERMGTLPRRDIPI